MMSVMSVWYVQFQLFCTHECMSMTNMSQTYMFEP